MRAGRFGGRSMGVIVGGEFEDVARVNVGGAASGSLSVSDNELVTDGANNSELSVTKDSWV
jgi:hypothetical protein